MSLVAAISERISDRLNPIVVKELRQAVQSRFVSVAMVVFLTVQVIVIGMFLLVDSDIANSFSGGARIFAVLQGILVATCILFVPAYTGIRLAAERSKVDLMFISAIKPWSIVRGKFLGATVLTILLFAACMPFMTFTYLLRGIDLPSIFLTMTMGFVIVLASTQLAILWASIPGSLVAMIVLGILLAAYMVVSAIGMAISLAEATYMGIGSAMWTWLFWAGAGTNLLTIAMHVGLLMALSVALLSPPSANRMLPVRIYTTIMWLVSAVVAGLWAYYSGPHFAPIYIWAVASIALLSFMMLVAVSERDHWGPRVARKIPRSLLLRPWAFLFFTGWAGGVAWCVILMALTLIGAAVALEMIGTSYIFDWDDFARVVALALYAYAYPMTALLLRRTFFRNRIKCGVTWLIAVGLFIAATLLPVLVHFMIYYDKPGRIDGKGLWLVGFPFQPFFRRAYLDKCLWFAGAWSLVVFVLSLLPFLGRYAAFKPLRATPRPIPQADQQPGDRAQASNG